MFKKILKFSSVVACLLVALTLVGCNKKAKDATAYGIVHKDYVGYATVTAKGGTTEKVKFEEAYLPHTWAQVTNETISEAQQAYVFTGADGNKYAKYISIDGKVLTASDYAEADVKVDGGNRQRVKYSNTEISNLFTYLKTDANGEWYVKALTSGKAFACKEDGTKVTDLTLAKTKFTKSEDNYWPAGGNGLGWKANMTALENAIKADNFKNTPTMAEGETKVKFGSTVSEATLVDYLDYYNVAKAAFDKIK